IERFDLFVGLAGSRFECGLDCDSERVPSFVSARQHASRGFADVANAERIDEARQLDLAPRFNRTKEVVDALVSITLALDQFVAMLVKSKDVRRLSDPAEFEKLFDLLEAEPLDVHRAARHEMAEVLDLLERAGEFAGAAADTSLFC